MNMAPQATAGASATNRMAYAVRFFLIHPSSRNTLNITFHITVRLCQYRLMTIVATANAIPSTAVPCGGRNVASKSPPSRFGACPVVDEADDVIEEVDVAAMSHLRYAATGAS